MLTPGQVVANYRILRELGRGGMGSVFAAEDCLIARKVAIKVLHPELSQNPAIASRFLNEARAVNLVQHPGLVEIYQYDVLPDGSAYMVMEYLDGETLSARLLRLGGPLRGQALPIAYQIAQALGAAHAKDIIHRDLKPENVMIIADRQQPGVERIKVLDFGIAKLAAAGGPGGGPKTATGTTMGTAEYMSPEQCVARPLSGKSDTYALGVMLYEMLAGQLPFRAEFGFELMRLHVYETPRPLRELDPLISEGAAQLVASMLAKDPEGRPTLAEVQQRIEGLCPDLVLRAVPLPEKQTVEPVLPTITAPTLAEPPILSMARRPRRWPLLFAGGLLLVLAVVALRTLSSAPATADRGQPAAVPAKQPAPVAAPVPPAAPPPATEKTEKGETHPLLRRHRTHKEEHPVLEGAGVHFKDVR